MFLAVPTMAQEGHYQFSRDRSAQRPGPGTRGSFIQWAANRQEAAIEDVGIDHGGLNVLVAEQFLDCADTCPDRRCWVS